MGASQSNALHQPPSRALHVLRVAPSSPASKTNIEPFFDFVVGFEGDSLASQKNIDVSQLERIVESHEGKALNLLVWNSKHQDTRVVPIVPSRTWALSHLDSQNSHLDSEHQPSLLGLSMRICEPELALDNVWHVLDVLEGSPAESAGLVPYGDWIVGWSSSALSAEGDFYELVESHVDKPLRVYVYSYDFDTLREVVLVPNRQWGGEGLLGCVFGFGLLHRIPVGPDARMMAPDADESYPEYEEQELFVPSSMPGGHHEPHGWNHDDPRVSSRGAEQSLTTTPRESHDLDRNSRTAHGNGVDYDIERHSLDRPSFSGNVSSPTPRGPSTIPGSSYSTRSHSFGTLMNGSGTARILSPRSATPIASLRPPPHTLRSGSRYAAANSDGNGSEDDTDGEAKLESDTQSLSGSVTSID